MSSRVTVTERALKKVKRAVAWKTLFVAKVFYRTLFDSQRVDMPYYSGAYQNTWTVNQTNEGVTYEQGNQGDYERANPNTFNYLEPNYLMPLASWYITSDYWMYDRYTHKPRKPGMARWIEYRGTPGHGPWKTMVTAYKIVQLGGNDPNFKPNWYRGESSMMDFGDYQTRLDK